MLKLLQIAHFELQRTPMMGPFGTALRALCLRQSHQSGTTFQKSSKTVLRTAIFLQDSTVGSACSANPLSKRLDSQAYCLRQAWLSKLHDLRLRLAWQIGLRIGHSPNPLARPICLVRPISEWRGAFNARACARSFRVGSTGSAFSTDLLARWLRHLQISWIDGRTLVASALMGLTLGTSPSVWLGPSMDLSESDTPNRDRPDVGSTDSDTRNFATLSVRPEREGLR